MSNSSFTVQDTVDDARSNADLAPAIPTGGYSDAPAISIANDVMQDMVQGGQDGQPFNWKWNRMLDQSFFINSWQQDYFIPNLFNLGWIESCTAVNFSTTQYPKPVYPVEVKRDLLVTYNQNTACAKICWMENDTLLTGTWGQSTQASPTGLTNPGPGAVYTNPASLPQMPVNPITAIKDAFGNLWCLTGYGTCGNANPFLSNLNPVYPTLKNTSTVATTVADGTCTWTAINPKGQGFRINPIPGQTGPVFLIQPVGQSMVPMITSLQQYVDPIPDNFYKFFKQGFFTQCTRRSPDPKVRAKYDMEYKLWLKALHDAVMLGANQEDDWGFVPANSVMDTGYAYNPVTPSMPFGPWCR